MKKRTITLLLALLLLCAPSVLADDGIIQGGKVNDGIIYGGFADGIMHGDFADGIIYGGLAADGIITTMFLDGIIYGG